MFPDENDSGELESETLGGRIVHAREAQKLTTSQLARRLGVKTETLQSWETDRAEPRPNRLLILAGLLSVSPTWLLTGEGASPSHAVMRSELALVRDSVEHLRRQAQSIAEELRGLEERLELYENYDE
jgi:transcriptional regulator with XRE-family HTH domain